VKVAFGIDVTVFPDNAPVPVKLCGLAASGVKVVALFTKLFLIT